MPKKNNYSVPEEMRHDYKMLVQRANRHIKALEKAMIQEGINDPDSQFRLLGQYVDREQWHTKSTPLSRSVVFKSKTAFEQYEQHLKKIAERDIRSIKKGYRDSVVGQLYHIAINNNISMPNGKLPKEMIAKVDSMTLPQLLHWFDMGDIEDDMEAQRVGTDDFAFVTDWEDFVDTFDTRMADLQRVY